MELIKCFSFSLPDAECNKPVRYAREACQLTSESDLTTVNVFGSYFNLVGVRNYVTDCLWDIARKCNRRIEDAIRACLETKSNVNFVVVDYPNYPATGGGGVVEIVNRMNLAKINNGVL